MESHEDDAMERESLESEEKVTPYPLTVLFDGACPICDREIALMRRLDKRRLLIFFDFSLCGRQLASDFWRGSPVFRSLSHLL